MIVDLHSHYPMHLVARDGNDAPPADPKVPEDSIQQFILHLANKIANYQGKHDTPAVTIDSLIHSGVGVALSMLYAPFDEMDFSVEYGSPPKATYFPDLVSQITLVEASLNGHEHDIVVAHNPRQLAVAHDNNQVVLIHAVEGGFHLGADPATVAHNVEDLARRGVAYITPAHLFWRQIATNAPALPFMSDEWYHFVFDEPAKGLTELGEAVIEAAAGCGMLIDITHMSERSISETFSIVDGVHEAAGVIATHSACRFGNHEYNMSDDNIRNIAQRDGVVGLIMARYHMCDGLPGPQPSSFEESVSVVCRHIDRIASVTGSFDNIAIGSDQDGFIKPALKGLETPSGLTNLEAALADYYRSPEKAAKICSANALRVLGKWKGA